MSTRARSIAGALEDLLSGNSSAKAAIAFFEEFSFRNLRPEDLAEAARFLQKNMVPVELPGNPIDTCGTGGSGKSRINTSTLAAFVVAVSGGKVAKHGNKAASGRCGSFDLLETLGAKIDLMPGQELAIYEELGIVFLFARAHHPALARIAPFRKAYGKPTIFNLLGPLLNPAGTKRQLVGVSSAYDAQLMANAMKLLGIDGCVVQGSDGLDEVTVSGKTTVLDATSGQQSMFDPLAYGISLSAPEDLTGGSVDDCVRISREVAAGRGSKAHQDLVVVNAAHALLVAGRVRTLKAGLDLAREILASGSVRKLIVQYVELSKS